VSANASGLLFVDARLRQDLFGQSLRGYANARAAGVPATELHDPFVAPPEAYGQVPDLGR
jgi:hypothetical protein